MKKIHLTPAQTEKVKALASERGTLNRRTIVNGAGNLIGFAGEGMFRTLFPTAVHVNNLDYDFVYQGLKIEVKSRGSDKEPKKFWDCKVPEYSVKNQKNDVYVFMLVRNDGSGGYALGWITKADFIAKAKTITADNLLRDYQKAIVDVNFMVVLVSDLQPIETLATKMSNVS